MPATMSEIAKEVGITVPVVSRVVRKDPTLRITDDLRREIIGTIERMGGVKVRKYDRKQPKLTRVIMAPVSREFSDLDRRTGTYFDGTEFRHTERMLWAEKFRLNITFFASEDEQQVMESLVRSPGQCDALLLLSGVANENLAKLLHAGKFPHVCDSPEGEKYKLNCVRVNAADGIRQALAHLVELGHRRIGYLGDRDFYRYPLMVGNLMVMGLPIDDQQNCWVQAPVFNIDWQKLGYTACQQWLQRGPTATALICRNDLLAFGAIDAIRDAGLTPGKDISIVGYDNIEQREYDQKDPQLTTVDNPRDQVGQMIGESLIRQLLHGRQHIVTELLPANLIVRHTTGPCPEA